MRRAVGLLLAVAVAAAVVIGLSQARDRTPSTAAAPAYDLQGGLRALDGSPPRLARLHAQANRVLGGGTRAFERRLRALRGTPVVVNVWASWCGPCRHESPFLQRVSTTLGKRVAFLGVATKDARGPATAFLREHPLPYPTYLDARGQPLVRALDLPANAVPLTAFVARDGSTAFLKAGGYASERELLTDVRRYLRP